MRWLLSVLKSRTFLIIFGFLLMLGLVFTLGAYFEWDIAYQLIGVIVVLIIMIVILAVIFIRANRSADEIERSIKAQAEQQLISTRPDKQAEIQELQTQLAEAIEKLKQSKLGRGQRGRAALYALPWYMFVGPPGSGKTTAIANSGLNFPIGIDRVRGVGGTRNCDWFFSDSAILLDTAGRYMTEEEDREEWMSFLDTLKQHRAERPINGVIVGIAMPDLALATPDEIEWHADTIRRRTDELIAKLGVRFPIYLVFTKCDMLQGFVEFFGELTRREREQIWGSTLDDQQQESKNLRGVFDDEFDRLVRTLINRRSARLSRPMKREERQKVYAFPLQLASVKDNLGLFVARLFQPNPYQESPIFRGFYLTSGTQEGVPLDRVILSIARQFDLPTTGLHEFGTETEAKSYFIKDFFTEVVVPDQYLAQTTSKASRKGTVQRLVVSVAAVVLLGLFLFGASLALISSKGRLSDTQNVAASVGLVRWDDRRATIDNIARVDELRQQVEVLDKTALLSIGLSRNGTVRVPAYKLYLDHVRAFVRGFPFQKIESSMRSAISGDRIEGSEREALTADLKAYLLVTEESARLEDELNYNFLTGHLTLLAMDELENQAGGMTRGELRAQIEPQILAYVNTLQEDSSMTYAPDVSLIRRTRQRIDEPPSIRSLYARLKLEGRDNVDPFRLEDAIPGRYGNLLTSNREVSGFFTKTGWDTFVSDRIDEVSQNPTGEDWVMGREGDDTPDELDNTELVAYELENLYFEEYASEWLNFLRSVRVTSFRDMRDASRALQDLSDRNNSPIVYLLAHVTDQTTFENELLNQLGDQVQEGIQRRIEGAARRALRIRPGSTDTEAADEKHPVDRRFQRLHSLKANLAESNEASPDLYSAFESLQDVSNTFDEISGDDVQAADFAAEVLDKNGGDLDRALRTISRSLSNLDQDVRSQLFEAPVGQAWAAVLVVAQQYLNERWQDNVYQPFQDNFAGQFPFESTSSSDAFVSDVGDFFNPQSGAVAQFLSEDLAPYIGRDVDRPSQWQNRGIRLSPAAVQAIKRAQGISDNLFESGSMRIEFEMQPEVPDRTANAPSPDGVSVRLHGVSNEYLMGSHRPWEDYDWPGRDGGVTISVSTEIADLPPKSYDGNWAFFRMLQDARLSRTAGDVYQLLVPFEQAGQYTITVKYNLRTQSSSNPFNDPRGFFNFRPPSKLD